MKTIHSTDKAPAAIGPYNQACSSSTAGLLFTSGQIALDPSTGKLVDGGIEEQCRQVLKNLQAVIQSAGCQLTDVLKVTIFVRQMSDYAALNAIYGEFFVSAAPARSAVAVSGLPMDVLVEMEAVVQMHPKSS